jgi:8-amino-7-oxononanoate synthase
MMGPSLLAYYQAIEQLGNKSRRRHLTPRQGIDFTSNDYLALASSGRMRERLSRALADGIAIGAGGSRLLRGNAPEHEQLESTAATFFGAESALFFGSGYVANYALFSTLPQVDDLLVIDALAHASTNEGAKAGRAPVVKARHSDPQSFEDAIRSWRAAGGRGRPWIAVESLYSMDGDLAPLDDLISVAEQLDAMLVVDEAHATGIYGPNGRGLTAAAEGQENLLVLHTCGKALGAAGALVTGPRIVKEFLVNRCRPFIYSTAPSPLMAVAVHESLNILRDEPERRERLARLVDFARTGARTRSLDLKCASQIMPLVIGDDARAMGLAASLSAHGFDVRGIRPPTVPEGTARLRISITLNVDEQTVSELLDALAMELSRLPP